MTAERKPEPHELRAGKAIEITFPSKVTLRRVKGSRVVIDVEPLPQEIRRAIDKVSTID
jgi:hypothetical protein